MTVSEIHNHNQLVKWEIREINLSIQFLFEELEKGNVSDIEDEYHSLMEQISALQAELITEPIVVSRVIS